MHLVASISGHGYGHVAQTAPVLNALYARLPQLRLTVRSCVPPEYLRLRIKAPFEHLDSEGDIGMLMSSALDVRVEDSRRAYRAFHAKWDARVAEEARLLHELHADLVLSNVGYLPLAGAQLAGIQNVALCSLNWADIYRHYCGEDEIYAQMHACYVAADAFLRTTPGMAMQELPNLVVIPPIATAGCNRRAELNNYLHLAKEEKLVLVSLGGIKGRLPVERWQHLAGIRWLVQQNWQVEHEDAITIESLPMDFCDLLASSDALLCKPGYGSFAEAAYSGVPVLYAARPDWPESPPLIAWLKQYGVCMEVDRGALERGDFAGKLADLWNTPRTGQAEYGGAEKAADWLAKKLSH